MLRDDVNTLLEQELDRRKIAFEYDGEEDRYLIADRAETVEIYLHNLRTNLGESREREDMSEFVSTLLRSRRPVADWSAESANVYYRFLPTNFPLEPNVVLPISESCVLAAALAWDDLGVVCTLDASQLKKWGVSRPEFDRRAYSNLDAALREAKIELVNTDAGPYGFFESDLLFKSALLAAPSLKRIVDDLLGWPLFAVIPSDDFAIFWPAANKLLAGRMGGVVTREYDDSPWKISTELYEFDDAGISAVGDYASPS